mmetsp:Transcript_717/g.1436  ORF Transcript_717/g.1436 Transcript_717/m.1436 type:complete len:615 (+) Transcript_717:35-1879(+)
MTEKLTASAGATSKLDIMMIGRAASPDRVMESGSIRRQFSAPTSPNWGTSSAFRLLRPEVISLSRLSPARLTGATSMAAGSKSTPHPARFPASESTTSYGDSGGFSSKTSATSATSSRSGLQGGDEAVIYTAKEAFQHLGCERCGCGTTIADGSCICRQCGADRDGAQALRSARSLASGRFRPVQGPKVFSASARSISGLTETIPMPPASDKSLREVCQSPPPQRATDSEATFSLIEQHLRKTIDERLNEVCSRLEKRLLERLEFVQQHAQDQLVDVVADLRQAIYAQADSQNGMLTTLLHRVDDIDSAMKLLTVAQVSADNAAESLQRSLSSMQEEVAEMRCALSEERCDRLAGEKSSAQGLEQLSVAVLKEAQARAKNNEVLEDTIADERIARGEEISDVREKLSQVQKQLEQAVVSATVTASLPEVPDLDQAERLTDSVNEQKARLDQEKLLWSAWKQEINKRFEEGAQTCQGLSDMLQDVDTQMIELRSAIEVWIVSEGDERRETACTLADLQKRCLETEAQSEQLRGEAEKLSLIVSREVQEERIAREKCDQDVKVRLNALEEVYEDAYDFFRASSKAEPMKPRGSSIVGVDAAVQLRNSRTFASVECL